LRDLPQQKNPRALCQPGGAPQFYTFPFSHGNMFFFTKRVVYEGEAPKSMNPKVFPNLKRTHEYENLPYKEKITPHMVMTYDISHKQVG
jgi:hypothetical protein